MRNYLNLIVILLTLFTAPAFAAPIVTNGGFETGDFHGWTLWGTQEMTYFEDIDDSAPAEGAYYAYFGPVGQYAGISQTLNTTPGVWYFVTFWLANTKGPDPANDDHNGFKADFGSTNLLTLEDAPAFDYTKHTFAAQASTASTNLVFGFREDPGWYYLDGVSVTVASTPEPATASLIGGGLVLMALTLARRR